MRIASLKPLAANHLSTIAVRARWIDERLTRPGHSNRGYADDALAAAHLEQWCQAVAKGDWMAFERWLAQQQLTPDAVRQVLGRCDQGEQQVLAAWMDTLQAVLTTPEDTPPDRCINSTAAIPFEAILIRFVQVARHRMLATHNIGYDRLQEACQISFERELLHDLSFIAARTLLAAFGVFRVLGSANVEAIPSAGDTQYQAFVQHLHDGGLLSLFEEYPVLARLLASQVERWINTTTALLQRLQTDWPAIVRMFRQASDHDPITQIVDVAPGLSDPHRGGATTASLTFSSGLRLIYKPKSLGIEATYQHFITSLHMLGLSPTLKSLIVLDHGDYGWVEYIAHHPCHSQEEVQRYYYRGGMLLALTYALRGTDYHYQNVIACGDQPVLIDHEMLFSPVLPQPIQSDSDDNVATAYGLALREIERSVLRTGLLNSWGSGPNGQLRELSGLGSGNDQSARRLTWKFINTDAMARRWEPSTQLASTMPHVPLLAERPCSLHDYSEQILAGFQYMYCFLLAHRTILLAPNGPLELFKNQTTRFVFRSTSRYWALLETSLAPKHLRDGAARSIVLEQLGRITLVEGTHPWLYALIKAEQTSLAQMDLPYFTMRSDQRAISTGDTVLEDLLPRSGYACVVEQLTTLSQHDLEQQLLLIQAALAAQPKAPLTTNQAPSIGQSDSQKHSASRHPDRPTPVTTEELPGLRAVSRPAPPEGTSPLKIAAEAIAHDLEKQAIHGSDGITWLRMLVDPAAGCIELQPIPHDLYSGSCGIALFLAALSDITGESRYHRLAASAVQPLRNRLRSHIGYLNQTSDRRPDPAQQRFCSPKRAFAEQEGEKLLTRLGGATGLGAVIYALVRLSQFLHDPALLEDAQTVAALITPQLIATDTAYDIIGGSAGAILGLLALYQISRDEAVLSRAIVCGEHLLAVQATDRSGCRAWPTLDRQGLTGFAHGAAGIAYALLRLWATSDRPAFKIAAAEAIAYEHSIFDRATGSWPSLLAPHTGQAPRTASWCHGSAGIGLARLAGLAYLQTDDIWADIAAALKATCRHRAQESDHLCCGAFGRIDLLVTASLRLERPEFAELAGNWASHIVERAARAGGYNLQTAPPASRAYHPSLFQGTAGIGYELLRLMYPDRLPSVLLWE